MLEKVTNPFNGLYKDYHCFGCSEKNRKGLHLTFYRSGDTLWSYWHPDTDLQGYHNVLHGGIQATLADEIAAWWVYAIGGTAGFTSRLSIRYLKSLSVVEGKIYLTAEKVEQRRNIIMVNVKLFNSRLNVCAMAEVDFFTFSPEKARRDMYYPGLEAFRGERGDATDYGFPGELFRALA